MSDASYWQSVFPPAPPTRELSGGHHGIKVGPEFELLAVGQPGDPDMDVWHWGVRDQPAPQSFTVTPDVDLETETVLTRVDPLKYQGGGLVPSTVGNTAPIVDNDHVSYEIKNAANNLVGFLQYAKDASPTPHQLVWFIYEAELDANNLLDLSSQGEMTFTSISNSPPPAPFWGRVQGLQPS